MRYFAGDVLPELRLGPTMATPWVLPSGLNRQHRSRLVNLLAAALRGADPGLRLVKLAWAERALLGRGLRLGPNTLVWWRVKDTQLDDPSAMLRACCDLHHGPSVFDVGLAQPAAPLVWLAPLKLAVQEAILSALYDEAPIHDIDGAAEAVREVAALVVSPVDLLDFANVLISRLASGERLALARAGALAEALAARLGPDSPARADAALLAVVRLATGRALEPEDRALLEGVGLMDPGAPSPSALAAAVTEPTLARCAVEALVRLQAPGRPLRELVPVGLLGEAHDPPPPSLSPMTFDAASPPSRLTWDEAVVVILRLTRAAREGRALSEEELGQLVEVIKAAEQATRRGTLGAEERRDVIDRARAITFATGGPPEALAAALLQLVSLALLAAEVPRAEEALASAAPGITSSAAPRLQAELLRRRAQVGVRRNRLGEAEDAFTQALQLYRRVEDLAGEADTLWALGDLYLRTARLTPAEESYTQALQLYKCVDDSLGEANTRKALGDLYLRTGRHPLAEESYTQALQLYRRLENSIGEASTRKALGDLYLRTGRLAPAEDAYTQALQLYKRVESWLGEANTLQARGDLFAHTARLAPAEESYTQALRLYKRGEDSLGEANTLRALGGLYVRTARRTPAEDAYTQALQLFQRVENSLGEANTLQALGDLYANTARFAPAEETYTQALRLYKRLEDSLGEANTLQSMGDLYLRTARFASAEETYTQALQLFKRVDARIGEANTNRSMGNLAFNRRRPQDALPLYHRAKALFSAIEERWGLANTLADEARCYAALNDPAAAARSAQEALQLGEALGNTYATKVARETLAGLPKAP
jgi:tetratricopeptide (TPR) repeat protein